MRIQAVTGDLPAVAQLTNEGVAQVEEAPVVDAAPLAVAAAAAAGETGGDPNASDRRRPPSILLSFDPPLIAQRAVLGLPVGPMVASYAAEAGISYNAACAAVDREMPHQQAG